CADACETNGLTVPELSVPVKANLAAFLPPAASLANPVDMIASASPDHYRRAIEIILSSNEVDSLIIIYIPLGLAELSAMTVGVRQGVGGAREKGGAGKPVLTCLMDKEWGRTQLELDGEQAPSYVYPEAAADVLGKAVTYAEWRAQPPGMIFDFD